MLAPSPPEFDTAASSTCITTRGRLRCSQGALLAPCPSVRCGGRAHPRGGHTGGWPNRSQGLPWPLPGQTRVAPRRVGIPDVHATACAAARGRRHRMPRTAAGNAPQPPVSQPLAAGWCGQPQAPSHPTGAAPVAQRSVRASWAGAGALRAAAAAPPRSESARAVGGRRRQWAPPLWTAAAGGWCDGARQCWMGGAAPVPWACAPTRGPEFEQPPQ